MQSPLCMQEEAHRRDASGPSPARTSSITPVATSTGDAAMLAGATLGQASTHFAAFDAGLQHLTGALVQYGLEAEIGHVSHSSIVDEAPA